MAIVKVKKIMLEKNSPYLKKIQDNILYLPYSEYEENISGDKIDIYNKKVSKKILKELITNSKYIAYIEKIFSGEKGNIIICYMLNGQVLKKVEFNKVEIIIGISKLINNGELVLAGKEKELFDKHKCSISDNSLINDRGNRVFNISIDSEKYKILVSDIILFMKLSDYKFLEICRNSNIKYIYGIEKEKFIYAVIMYLESTKLYNKYKLAYLFKDRYDAIVESKIIDIESINTFNIDSDKNTKQAVISDELKNEILSNIPDNFTKLQKAIYIYIKMCKLLTYNIEYFAVAQAGAATLKHKNIDYITKITPENNQAVCFEFNLIYSKFLEYLGIKYESFYEKGKENYGDGHSCLQFRCDKFIVGVDSVTSILNGDFVNAKLNEPLNGIDCLNISEETKSEFDSLLLEIYKELSKEQGEKIKTESESLDDLLDEYSSLTDNLSNVNLKERLFILIDKVNSKKLFGLDEFSYMLKLKKILFDRFENLSNISICIVRNNAQLFPDTVATISAVITINDKNINAFYESNGYFIYDLSHKLEPITLDKLKEKFENGELEYIVKEEDPYLHNIPGIDVSKGAIL